MDKPSLDTEIKAAANNAGWCDAMLRSHSRTTQIKPYLWSTSGDAPLYYPHAVTLGGPGYAAQQYADIAALLQAASRNGRSIAVKDSFACLDLTSLSCELLFAADWLSLAQPVPAMADGVALNVTWRQVQNSADLALWEQAWCGSPQVPEIFLPPLLANPDIAVLAGYMDGQIAAGCTLYRSPDTVGYTNLFVPPHEAEGWRRACIAEIMRLYPSCPIFGYESGQDSIAMQNIGFCRLGELLVWRSAD
ncbi:MAG TPA: hypothetical protein VL462_00530 [Candidatus Nitrosotalea sp.]|jgi:hypothetical protein|nr:hypothetical protein [Candidatus Nitrosotalea sp.]